MSIKIEYLETYGWKTAVRGMRNPRDSHDKIDSNWSNLMDCCKCPYGLPTDIPCERVGSFIIGPNDRELMQKLIKRGSVHAKFRRFIGISCDITAPLYWWPDFDIYKVRIASNSQSRLNRFISKPFEESDFDFDPEEMQYDGVLEQETLMKLNSLRDQYLKTKDLSYIRKIYAKLPCSFLQKRTIDMTYENIAKIYAERKNHILQEYRDFCEYMEEHLPESWIFTERW